MTHIASSTGKLLKPLVLIMIILMCWHTLSVPSAAQKKSSRRAVDESPQQLFARGIFYYKNGDTSDKCSDLFKRVIKQSPNSGEAEQAQYYLGSYYQQKFYRQSERYGETDYSALDEARSAYEEYIKKYDASVTNNLADAYFNLSLVYLQQGVRIRSEYYLSKMKEVQGKDQEVYIYQLIWSSNQSNVIDGKFETRALAEYAASRTNLPFDSFINVLKLWCKSHKGDK
jgi:tetratricopeptide (TPR) repeat protein